MNKNAPLFLVPPGDEIIHNWKHNFQKLEQSQDDLVFTVNPTIVDGGQVAGLQQMIIALQHYPHLIERMVFSVKFKFMLVDDVAVELSEGEWKKRPEVYRWFYAVSQLPMTIYFINDPNARGYCLVGDLLASGNFTSHLDANSKQTGVEFSSEQYQLIADRLFHGAWSFFMYCHATGFDPGKYIDALLADFDMPFTAADVRKKYEEDLERGIQFSVEAQP